MGIYKLFPSPACVVKGQKKMQVLHAISSHSEWDECVFTLWWQKERSAGCLEKVDPISKQY